MGTHHLTRIPEAGAALIITLAALTLLLSLGSLSVSAMMAESRQAQQFAALLQARLAAQAGIERAIAELKREAETHFEASSQRPWFYRSSSEPSYARPGAADSGLLPHARYILNIRDAASRVHINDSNSNLAAILQNFSKVGPALAARLAARLNMPGGRYVCKEQILNVQGVGPAAYEALAPHITVTAYQDPNTKDAPRSPVNVNTASQDVLCAVLQPLLSNALEAKRVAEDIMAARPMAGWAQYEAWLASVPSRIGTLSAAELRNLKDNMNPNRVHAWKKANANVPQAKVGTEFCFHSGGIFEIDSTGQALSRSGEVTASVTLQCHAHIFDVFTITSKEQFRDNAEFLNITWADDCPVNSQQETAMGYVPGYDRVNDALKLGFWDDFEDTAFSQAAWQNRERANGSGFRLENSDTRNQAWEPSADRELHHSGVAQSANGKLELAYPGGRRSGEPAPRAAWQFANAYLRVDSMEDDAALRADPDSGCDDVAHLAFRHAGNQEAEVFARYPGVQRYEWPAGSGSTRPATIYQNPLGDDSAWWDDAQHHPINKDAQRHSSDPALTVLREADESPLARPLQEGRVIATDGQTFKESTIAYPPRAVLQLEAWPLPAQGGDGQGLGDAGTGRRMYALNGGAANPYRYHARRTLRLHTVNRQAAAGPVPGVRLQLSQEIPGGAVRENWFPGPGEASYYNTGAGNVPYAFGPEINTAIAAEGTILLKNHASFPSWDNLRVLTPLGMYQSPVMDAGYDNVRWGTLNWTLSLPASAAADKEKVAFEARTFAALTAAQAHGLYDWPDAVLPQESAGWLDGNRVGSGQAPGQSKGRLRQSGLPLAGLSQANHGERYLLLKAWLSSERYACDAAQSDPSLDDARFLKETPVLEDITVTCIPTARVGGYREGPAA